MSEIDAANLFAVGIHGNAITVQRPVSAMSKDEALNLAAWIVALADDHGRFSELLETVQGT